MKPTMHLRWMEVTSDDCSSPRGTTHDCGGTNHFKLQQWWADENGAGEWRDVPQSYCCHEKEPPEGWQVNIRRTSMIGGHPCPITLSEEAEWDRYVATLPEWDEYQTAKRQHEIASKAFDEGCGDYAIVDSLNKKIDTLECRLQNTAKDWFIRNVEPKIVRKK